MPYIELISYVLLTLWALFQSRGLLKHRPLLSLENARSLLFVFGLYVLVMRYWLMYFSLID